MMYHFDSKIKVGPRFSDHWSDHVIKAEPMFFNSSLRYAFNNGGPITKSFIHTFITHSLTGISDFYEKSREADRLWDEGVFDSRVHMLMKNWFPCIPGFHHDDVPRGAYGQPDYDTPEYHATHCMGLVNSHLAPTQFALGSASFEKVPADEVVYKVWHPVVEDKIRAGVLSSCSAPEGKLIFFDAHTWHQGTRATGFGWRWFGRISLNTGRSAHITNEIRKQVQVYLEFPMEGW